MSDILFTFPPEQCSLPFILNGLGMDHTQEPIRRPTGMPLFQWIQCVRGQGRLYLHGKEYTVRPGQGMFLYPDEGHMYQSIHISEPWIVHFVCFNGYGVKPLLSEPPFKASGVFTLSAENETVRLMQKMYSAPPMAPAAAAAFYSGVLYELLLHLLLHAGPDQGRPGFTAIQRLSPVITYIEENYMHPLYLEDMAGLCGLSKEYLCQIFKTAAGMSIFTYIQQTRIKHSKELLLGMPDLPAHRIGQLCGFNSSSYFNKIFKKIEHISPGEFRHQNGIRSPRAIIEDTFLSP